MLAPMKKLCHFLNHPVVHFTMGVILFVTNFLETIHTIEQDIITHQIRGHHGLMVFGAFMALKAFTEMMGALEDITS